MLDDAVLPPSDDHMYAQWREKPEIQEGMMNDSESKCYLLFFITN